MLTAEARIAPPQDKPLPEDLKLPPAAVFHSRAVAHYAKGLYLFQEAVARAEDRRFLEDVGLGLPLSARPAPAAPLIPVPEPPLFAPFRPGAPDAPPAADPSLCELAVACQLEPESVTVLDTLAWVLFRKGQHAAALKAIRHALRRAVPTELEDAVILDHAGEIAAANRQWEDARRYWQAALQQKGADAGTIRAKLERVKTKN